MFKKTIAIALLTLTSFAMAEQLVVTDAKAQIPSIVQKCTPDCVVLDRADWEALQARVNEMLAKVAKEAYNAGRAKERGTI